MQRATQPILIGISCSLAACLDLGYESTEICPEFQEDMEVYTHFQAADGLDLLVVIDNSGSMAEEQRILATGFYTLVNSLADPVDRDETWSWPAVDNIRVAMVSSNLGLQYSGSTDGYPYGLQVSTCTDQPDPKGDDGRFLDTKATAIRPESGEIACEAGGTQCPAGWACSDMGTCTAPSGTGGNAVSCAAATDDSAPLWAETSKAIKNPALATQVACMAQQGTSGCGVEQSLEAALRGLTRSADQVAFIDPSHVLAVVVVSDEEDCSVQDSALYHTWEFRTGTSSGGKLNVGCNLPAENEAFLFPTSRYREQLVALKNGAAGMVFFSAIAGVPRPDEPGDDQASKYLCQGTGEDIRNCFGTEGDPHDKMVFEEKTFLDPANQEYIHFAPSCERYGEDPDNPITMARPGRRMVKVAQSFGANGYVYSICNEDWSPALRRAAESLAAPIGSHCLNRDLPWERLPTGDARLASCAGCGASPCQLGVEVVQACARDGSGCPAPACPQELGSDPAAATAEVERDDQGRPTGMRVFCPLRRIPAPLDCAAIAGDCPSDGIGWCYCTGSGERCWSDVRLTEAAEDAVAGRTVLIRCPKRAPEDAGDCPEVPL